MLRIVRLNERATKCAARSRGVTLLVVALAAGGCSAGFDRLDLAPMNYNGGPSSTGAAPPIPREPIRQSQAPLAPQGEYRSDYRPDSQPAYRPDYRSDAYRGRSYDADRTAQPHGSDATVRMAGLPEPYDRAQPYDRGPLNRTTPTDAGRAPSRSIPPAPPQQASFDPPGKSAQPQGDTIEVRPGDTLYALAKTHRVPMSELMRVNNLTSPQLRIGQQLVLPSDRSRPRRVASLPTAPEPAYTPPPAYVPPTPPRPSARAPAPEPVLPHHTDAGPIVPPLPETPPPAAPSIASAPATEPAPPASTSRTDDSGWTGTYTVQRGDSLYGIARKHGIKAHVLERVNEITNPRKVMPGTVLKVPAPGDTPRVARVSQAPTPPATAAKRAPASSPSPVATSAPQESSRAPAPGDDHTRVASLGQGMTDASPPSATDAPQREAALPASKAAAPSGKFRWPARGKIISAFGNQPGVGPNDGINISVPRGTEVHAAESGVVTYAGNEVQGYGNLVLIRHPEGWITAYAHNDSLMVKAGENVRRGQVIAKAGNTGSVSQPQLHFEIRQGATPVDPMQHLER
jgi:murein DD-endopeptidase MepM/ murein hydrolase activator NlpD